VVEGGELVVVCVVVKKRAAVSLISFWGVVGGGSPQLA
jgi:hypothetical protein